MDLSACIMAETPSAGGAKSFIRYLSSGVGGVLGNLEVKSIVMGWLGSGVLHLSFGDSSQGLFSLFSKEALLLFFQLLEDGKRFVGSDCS